MSQLDAVGLQGIRQVVVVRFVQHHQHPVRDVLQERANIARMEQRSGRIVGVGDEHHLHVAGNRMLHRDQVVAEIARRDLDPDRASRLRDQGVYGERVLGEHGRRAGREERTCNELQHVIRPVAKHHSAFRDAMAGRDRAA